MDSMEWGSPRLDSEVLGHLQRCVDPIETLRTNVLAELRENTEYTGPGCHYCVARLVQSKR